VRSAKSLRRSPARRKALPIGAPRVGL